MKMANRYYTDDQERWTGPTHIGPGMKPEKMIAKFIFDGGSDTHIPALRTCYETAIGTLNGLRTKRSEAEASGQFTQLGITEKLAQGAVTGEIPALKRARVTTEKIKAEIAEKRASLTLPKPTEEQHREHAEIRSAMRAMTPDQREKFLRENRQDETVAAAIVGAIPALSGVDPTVRQIVADEQLQRAFGPELEALDDLQEVVNVVDKVTRLARDELREIVGCSKDVFETLVKVGENRGGELPLQVERRVIDGKITEVSRVYDIEAKEWRDATSDEIGRVA
jgi:hypothetical protein